MVKKLKTWIGRETTFQYGENIYHGTIAVSYNQFDPRSNYFFQTDEGKILPIPAHGKNKVRCINGGLVGVLRK